ncbi:MAG: hypothetical protein EA351_03530 [Gemmatimonadales bacterium]|nr:MAG: hypothetical protein EA351_03530 [Gemmatimonadales bacterium]
MSLHPDLPIHPHRGVRSRSAPTLAVALVPLLLLLVGVTACGADEDAQWAEETVSAPEAPADPMDGLQLTIGLERVEYQPGETVTLTLQLSNRGTEPRTLNFRTAQLFDVILINEAGDEVTRWSHERSFAQMITEKQIAPGEEGEVWEAEIEAPEEPGSYTIEAVILPAEGELRMSVPVQVTEDR